MRRLLSYIIYVIKRTLGEKAYFSMKDIFVQLPGMDKFLQAFGYSASTRRIRTEFLRLHFSQSRPAWNDYVNCSENNALPGYSEVSYDDLPFETGFVQEIWWDDDTQIHNRLISDFFRMLMPGGRLHIRSVEGRASGNMTQHGFYFLAADEAFQEFYKRVPLPTDYRAVNESAWENKAQKRPEKLTPEWRQHHISYTATREVLATLEPQRLVSFGCGPALLEILIAPEVELTVGIDISIQALKVGRKIQANREKQVELVNGAGQIPLADSTFDLCLLIEVIEHIYPDDMQEVLAEIQRILKPGGYLYLTTPNGEEYWDPGHVQFYTKDLLLRTALKNDWEVVWIEIEDRQDRYRKHDFLKALWKKSPEASK